MPRSCTAGAWRGEFRNVLRRGLLRLGRLEPRKQEQEQEQERPVVRCDMPTPGGATLRNSLEKPGAPSLGWSIS